MYGIILIYAHAKNIKTTIKSTNARVEDAPIVIEDLPLICPKIIKTVAANAHNSTAIKK